MDSSNLIKILVVEDTPGDVFLIKFYLEELDPDNYEIQSVDNLSEAHYRLEREAFDVVLLDLHLPDSQGIITLKKSVEKFPDDVFIVLTSLSDEKVGLEAVKHGAQDFLVKGRIDSKTLDSSIKFSFQRSKLQREVKILGSAYRNLEIIYDMAIVVIDTRRNIVYHTLSFKDYIDVNSDSIDTLEDLMKAFENNEKIQHAITNEPTPGEVKELSFELRGENYLAKLYKPKDQADELVITLKK